MARNLNPGRFLWANDNAQLAVGHIGDLIGERPLFMPLYKYFRQYGGVYKCVFAFHCRVCMPRNPFLSLSSASRSSSPSHSQPPSLSRLHAACARSVL